jgi:MFS family permease
MLLHLTSTVGQGSVAVLDPRVFDPFAIGSLLITLAALPMLLARVDQPKPIDGARIAVASLWRAAPVAVVGAAGAGLANGAFGSLLPVAAADKGVAPGNIALLMASTALSAAVAQWPLGLVSDRVGRRVAIILACAGAAGAAAFLGLRPPGPATPMLFGGAMAFGAFAFPLYILCIALAGDRVAPDAYVETAGGLLFVWSLGAIVGPVAASGLVTAAGGDALFAFTGATHLAVAAFALARMTRRPPPLDEAAERASFPDAVVVAATISDVAPDGSEETEPGDDAAPAPAP